MSVLMIPDDARPWPSLGGQVCDWIEANLVFGPGDLRGEPARLDDEKRALVWRLYEVYPKTHPQGGRRRFKRAGLSLRKGTAKTELAAWIAACELHPGAPVRCTGWKRGQPIGGPVTDPFIVLCAYTEEQSDELCYGALKAILEESPVARDFDIGLERILRKDGGGKAISVSGSPNARDGARTTFQVFDETHRMTLPRLKQAHQTMLANIPKRKLADAWTLETTTAPAPGEGAIAEDTMEYARQVESGRIKDERLFFFHRQASDDHDLTTEAGARAAIIEASGPAVEWSDIESILQSWKDPTTDRAFWERVWTNRLVQATQKAFNSEAFKALSVRKSPVRDGDAIALGFDGAMFHDSTGFVATHIDSGYQWSPGVWERPFGQKEWQVPAENVDEVLREIFRTYQVVRMYADPPYWQSWISKWVGDFGKEVVIEWWTNRRKPMSYALESFQTAIREQTLSHDGGEALQRHVGNAHKHETNMKDENGKALWLIQKERADSPHKIDLAMAAVLSWEARNDAIAAGLGTYREPQFFVLGGN